MNVVREIWAQVSGTQPAPPVWAVVATAVVALVLVVAPASWQVMRHVLTTAHEGGHGLAAWATGRRLRGIRLHSDSSGLAVSVGPARGPGMVLTLLAGYTGPALLGLAVAALLAVERAVGALWLLLALLALLLVQVRNLFGLWSVGVTGAALLAVSVWAPPQAQSLCAYAVTWFLLLAAPRPVLELQRARRQGRAVTSDADQLARLTHVPGVVWVGVFGAVTVGSGLAGALLLLR